MKKIWTLNLKKALLWLCGYLSFIAFAICGGYVIIKKEDEELKSTAKLVFFVTLIFTAIDALVLILRDINGLSGYTYGFSTFLSWFSFLIQIAEIAIYAAAIILSLLGMGRKTPSEAVEETEAEEEETDSSEAEPATETAEAEGEAVKAEENPGNEN